MTTSGTRLPCVQQLSKPLLSRMTLPITNTEPSELAITAVLWMATCLLLHCKDHSQCIWAAGLFMLNISFQAAGSAPLNPPHCVRLCTYIILHSVTQIFNRETGKLQLLASRGTLNSISFNVCLIKGVATQAACWLPPRLIQVTELDLSAVFPALVRY